MIEHIINREEYIICSAIHIQDAEALIHNPRNIKTGLVITGRRHHNCFETLSKIYPKQDKTKIIQGFLTSFNNFVDRKKGFQVARCAGQIKNRLAKGWDQESELTSEDLF